MPPVVALIVGERERAAFVRAIAPLADAHLCDRAEALSTLVARCGARVLVSGLRDRDGASVMPAIAALVQRHPMLTVLLYVPLTNVAARDALAAVASGAHVRLILRGVDDLGTAVLEALSELADHRAETSILQRIAPHVPGSLTTFFILCAARGSPQLTVTRAAAWSRTSPRTLQDRLRRSGLPAAWRIVGWCCALQAVWRLDVLDRLVKQVVAEMGFSSRSALSNHLARYCRCTPTTVGDHGGYPAMLDRFVELLRLGRGGEERGRNDSALGEQHDRESHLPRIV